jgi:hypothetical protein
VKGKKEAKEGRKEESREAGKQGSREAGKQDGRERTSSKTRPRTPGWYPPFIAGTEYPTHRQDKTRHKQTANPAARQRPVPPSKQGVQKDRARFS